MRCYLTCVVLLVVLSGCTLAARPITGDLHGEIFWENTVYLRGDVTIEEGATLHIVPGTQVVFLPPVEGEDLLRIHPFFPGSELIVRGRILARGTAEAPIVFRAAREDAGAGSWGAVNLRQSPEAVFSHCIFTQADSAIHSFDSQVRVTQSIFQDNLVALRFNTSDMHISHNLIRGNDAGIRFHYGAPVIEFNHLVDNGRAFFFTSHPRDYVIRYNNILDSRDYAAVLGEEVPEDVLMADNHWGTNDPERIEARFFDGRRLSYLGNILYLPLAQHPFPDAGPAWSP
ncbi:right-handed parallel beta-helix repeat-containing protein [Geoalkalibacter halelectricus]|uniref:Right-handed parallel beta-helix repeat-containing protein n=1 Tax=Geoalkalibacter halelectricus TaxID=2847045 RepID=A0ABY5ZHZ3_9BACT|nr:right-handed parallel beta-helix repeat-containing protein [Geoalkalibacter halelectricus]MDO3379430.1 right-handed parallel beta-helix repeat-containing protein [Geoalkalibacter halelectricus]UWZ78693.1 right-handed parallel beta-helix repeat-containing protein [Geoalkalibacter halelectricus]